MRRAFVRISASEKTILANKSSWRRSLDASLRKHVTKIELQETLRQAARNTAAIQQAAHLDDEVAE